MTYQDFYNIISNMNWFASSGKNSGSSEWLFADLDYWSEVANLKYSNNIELDRMNWLPTSSYQVDPFNDVPLKEKLSKEQLQMVMDCYKLTLKRLRMMDKKLFVSHENNFSEAAKGAALYCVRMTAMEILTGKEGRWREIFEVYIKGYWACGITLNNRMVVY